MRFKTYRLYKANSIVASNSDGCSMEGFEKEYKPTTIIFRARSFREGMKKANKFWQEAEVGMGSIIVKEENLTPPQED